MVDFAAMRDAVKRLGGNPAKINPVAPVDLVIDHSVQVDVFRRWALVVGGYLLVSCVLTVLGCCCFNVVQLTWKLMQILLETTQANH